MRQIRAILGFAVLALMLAAAVPFVVSAETARPRTGGLAQAAAQMTAPPPSSFRFSMQGSIADAADPANPFTFSAAGEQVGQDQTHLALTLDGAGVSGLPAVELTRTGTDLYLFLPSVISPTGSDQWVLVDGQTSGLAGMMSNITTMNPLDGTTVIAGLSSQGITPQTLADETINGVLTTHYRTVADANTLATATANSNSGVTVPQATVDVFVGKNDNLIRRITLDTQTTVDPNTVGAMLAPNSGVMSATGTVTANIAITADFTEFNNAALTVTAPANAVPFTDLTGGMTPGGAGGVGGPRGPGAGRALPTATPRP